MSQFMMCYSKQDLKKLKCTHLLSVVENRGLFDKVNDAYFDFFEYDNVWVFENIDNYFVDAQKVLHEGGMLKTTSLFNIIDGARI